MRKQTKIAEKNHAKSHICLETQKKTESTHEHINEQHEQKMRTELMHKCWNYSLYNPKSHEPTFRSALMILLSTHSCLMELIPFVWWINRFFCVFLLVYQKLSKMANWLTGFQWKSNVIEGNKNMPIPCKMSAGSFESNSMTNSLLWRKKNCWTFKWILQFDVHSS